MTLHHRLPLSVTHEQYRVKQGIRNKCITRACEARPTDRIQVEKALTGLYAFNNYPTPRFVWAASPLGALAQTSRLTRNIDWPTRFGPRTANEHSDIDSGEADIFETPGFVKAIRSYLLAHIDLTGKRHPRMTPVDSWQGLLTPLKLGVTMPRDGRAGFNFRDDEVVENVIGQGLLDPMESWLYRAALSHGLDRFLRMPSVFFSPHAHTSRLIPFLCAMEYLQKAYGYRIGENLRRRLLFLKALVKHTHWFCLFDRVCIVSENPVTVCTREVNDRLQIHSDDGPAVAFADGWEIYVLEGVRVPPQVVLEPADKLDPRLLLQVQNAEARRMIIAKIGMARVCSELGAATLDKHGAYELLALDLGDGRMRPFLKMSNPSTGERHIEGVAPECQTVVAALAWRNGTHKPPVMLT